MCTTDTFITYADRLRLAEIVSLRRDCHPSAGELEQVLRRVAPCDPATVPADVVTMDSVVVLRDLRTGEVRARVLAYPGTTTGPPDPVSVLSPMGTVLIGRRAGDVIRWSEAGEGRTARIEAVSYQPEAHARVAAE